mmetsp:Transcript_6936/g.21673  ORF Transcript_6936/g.21673 Transcript_6936/m.21673 type:complete len:259 (+) Transcript_6936:299-1075(+)
MGAPRGTQPCGCPGELETGPRPPRSALVRPLRAGGLACLDCPAAPSPAPAASSTATGARARFAGAALCSRSAFAVRLRPASTAVCSSRGRVRWTARSSMRQFLQCARASFSGPSSALIATATSVSALPALVLLLRAAFLSAAVRKSSRWAAPAASTRRAAASRSQVSRLFSQLLPSCTMAGAEACASACATTAAGTAGVVCAGSGVATTGDAGAASDGAATAAGGGTEQDGPCFLGNACSIETVAPSWMSTDLSCSSQ